MPKNRPGSSRIEHQARVADHLRVRLRARGFTIANDTPLVCFTHPRLSGAEDHDRVATRLRLDQTALLSRVLLGGHAPALRACITSHETSPDDMEALVHAVERALPA